jgi:hypothetical protein
VAPLRAADTAHFPVPISPGLISAAPSPRRVLVGRRVGSAIPTSVSRTTDLPPPPSLILGRDLRPRCRGGAGAGSDRRASSFRRSSGSARAGRARRIGHDLSPQFMPGNDGDGEFARTVVLRAAAATSRGSAGRVTLGMLSVVADAVDAVRSDPPRRSRDGRSRDLRRVGIGDSASRSRRRSARRWLRSTSATGGSRSRRRAVLY